MNWGNFMMRFIVMIMIILSMPYSHAVAENNMSANVKSLVEKKSVQFNFIGGGIHNGDYYAIMRVHANQGVKIYWINPGFGGIAPELDLSESENLKSYSVDWGMPQKVTHADLTNYIIPNGTELAVRLTPHDPTLPIMLKGRLHYGYCDTQCKVDTHVISQSFDINEKGDEGRLQKILEKKPVLLTEEYSKKNNIFLQEFFTQNVAKNYLMSFLVQGLEVSDENFFYSLDVEHELVLPIIQKVKFDTYQITIDTDNLSQDPKTLEILISRIDAPPLKIVKDLKFTKSPI